VLLAICVLSIANPLAGWLRRAPAAGSSGEAGTNGKVFKQWSSIANPLVQVFEQRSIN
jgi:hypothetical protein